jgi:hypothetical protein
VYPLPQLTLECLNQSLWNLVRISWHLSPSQQPNKKFLSSVYVPPIVARQRLGTNVTVVTNTHATIEELLDASFPMWLVSYRGKKAIGSSQNFLLFQQFRYFGYYCH